MNWGLGLLLGMAIAVAYGIVLDEIRAWRRKRRQKQDDARLREQFRQAAPTGDES
jgi:hypothetical protein